MASGVRHVFYCCFDLELRLGFGLAERLVRIRLLKLHGISWYGKLDHRRGQAFVEGNVPVGVAFLAEGPGLMDFSPTRRAGDGPGTYF